MQLSTVIPQKLNSIFLRPASALSMKPIRILQYSSSTITNNEAKINNSCHMGTNMFKSLNMMRTRRNCQSRMRKILMRINIRVLSNYCLHPINKIVNRNSWKIIKWAAFRVAWRMSRCGSAVLLLLLLTQVPKYCFTLSVESETAIEGPVYIAIQPAFLTIAFLDLIFLQS